MDAEPSDGVAPLISVLVCTLNGGPGLERCLTSVRKQSLGSRVQVIVVDDGSTDGSAEVAAALGAEVIRHPVNRGLAAARNTGIAAARAPVVATLDDDCEAEPDWAERLLDGFAEAVVGVGGLVVPVSSGGYFGGYLERNNPLVPLEMDLASSASITHRFFRYLLRNAGTAPAGARAVYSVATANAAFQVAIVRQIGGVDENFLSDEGGEDLDLCLRIGDKFGPGALRFEPSAVVRHHFDVRPQALLRRCRSYGRGGARLYLKRRNMPPTIYPFPLLVAALLAWSRGRAGRVILALVFPQMLFSNGWRNALRMRSAAPLLDCYTKLAEEANLNIGFATGLLRSLDRADSGRVQPDSG